ncbi:uncharacterized protein BCR38DRAFT_487141 [Pseudomassariella vexata]|uniref:P-type ATPase A domain-containing protein n=1 Tax=Pseudomassariella vexata TaxID=1141098 RepID=A0A1Y2DQC6_9PEZI|nr:uncharacterized protein BCR38DRAFT_487141 [Pseudomassariella vexata]ORY61389.1 hypothetical protein BCR38DRAFT_487141 [Pseudomassariella vexata]
MRGLKYEWITDINVNLLGSNARVEFLVTDDATAREQAEAKAEKLVETIEDMGFDASLSRLAPVESPDRGNGPTRTLELKVDGMHCSKCPGSVLRSLNGFRALTVITAPTEKSPLCEITYTPSPDFSIRNIIAAINANDKLSASIHHPESPDAISKRMHAIRQRQVLWRAIFTLVIAIPCFVIGIVYMSFVSEDVIIRKLLMEPWVSGINRAQIALFIMASLVYVFGADIFHKKAWKELRSLWKRGSRTPILQRFYRFGSMNMLMSLGTTIAYLSSVAQLIVAAVAQPERMSDEDVYFDSVVFLTLFLLTGQLIEGYSKSMTGNAIEMLGKLRPTTAILVEKDAQGNNIDTVVEADLLEIRDIVRIPYGSSPPCDGKLVEGETNFDESSVTGESRPIKKIVGDTVLSGTVNKSAPILIEITGAPGQSLLDQIIDIVREGQAKRAPIEQFADSLTAYFVPGITLLAILTCLIWAILGYSGAVPASYLEGISGGWFAFSIKFAIAVFVVACPCGIGLAAPTATSVGGGLAAKYGVLVKGGGESFEIASRIDCVVFDKTGTLTEGGEPTITDFQLYDQGEETNEDSSALWAVVRAVEENSSHPIAKAIVSFCSSKTQQRAEVVDIEETPGRGLKATSDALVPELDGFEIVVGNEALMREYGAHISASLSSTLQRWKTQAKSVALVAMKPTSSDDEESSSFSIAAALSISDPVRAEASAVIHTLRSQNIDVWMLSGDNQTTARAVALRIGIPEDNVISEVKPNEKSNKIKELQSSLKAKRSMERATVAMVGDGVNDAPALTVADVGIAIGSGSDVAIGSADFVLVKCDLRGIVTLIQLSRKVFGRIKVNFAWALVYNLLAVPVAAGAFYAIETPSRGHVRLDPVWASLAMAMSSISVVLSSLALRSGIPGLGYRETKIGA